MILRAQWGPSVRVVNANGRAHRRWCQVGVGRQASALDSRVNSPRAWPEFIQVVVSIFGDSQIPSTAVTQQLDVPWNTSSYTRSILGARLWFVADSDRSDSSGHDGAAAADLLLRLFAAEDE